jgi:NitT/TauT family transport system substrate-binding protein
MHQRSFLKAAAAAVTLAWGAAHAADTPIKFQLDWRFEGPAAFFLQPVAKGYFKGQGLDVTVDAGNGSGGAVQRVASGTYDMGFADLASVMEFHANNPDAPNKPVAVMVVYNNTPSSVMALKRAASRPRRSEGQEAGRPGVRRRSQGLPHLREGQQGGQCGLDGHGPSAARNHAGAR